MNRIYFGMSKFPKFVDETVEYRTWQDSFKQFGFKTYEIIDFESPNFSQHCHSLSEEEYTWFVLRWL